jgi:hypothetical protein
MEIAAGMVDDLTAAEEANNAVVLVSADRYDEMSTAVDAATQALEDQADELHAQMDPVFNLIDKTNDLADAQTASGVARDKYGQGSSEHLEALRKEARAFLNLKDAQVKAALESGITSETFGQNLRDMGIFTSTEIAFMIAEFDKLDGRVIDTTINVGLKGRGAGTFSDSLIGHKAGGGRFRAGDMDVVGEDGPELVKWGSGGSVIPNSAIGAGPTTNVYMNMGTVVDSARALREIEEMGRRRGG